MSKQTPISRVIDLHRLIVAFGAIERKIFLPDSATQKDRWENDIEHSYTLTMIVWFISQNNPKLDSNQCIRYALVHDLIEVHAGATFAYDHNVHVHDSKEQREREARVRLEREWPDFNEMNSAIENYELQEDAESRFVFALDKLTPIVLNVLGEEKSWHHHKLSLEDLKKQKAAKIAVSPEVATLYKELLGILEQNSHYFPA